MTHLPSDMPRTPGETSDTPAKSSPGIAEKSSQGWRPWLDPQQRRRQMLAFILPLVVFMVMTSIEPTRPPDGEPSGWFAYEAYPYLYAVKIGLTAAALAWSWPAIRGLASRVSLLSVAVGVIGVVLWVLLSQIETSSPALTWLLGERGTRSAYNPLEQISSRPAAWLFLAVRLVGLAVVVPLAEELCYRGFVMRFLTRADWWTVPLGQVSRMALLLGTALPVLAHPERLAALVWFSLVTWLMVKTGSFWNCVVAHGVTNLLLGVYVLVTGNWWLL